MTRKEILLRKISTYKFAIYELRLYLDTHPNCRETIAKIREYEEKMRPLVQEYEKEHGLLTKNNDNKNKWTWVNDPWPWEGV